MLLQEIDFGDEEDVHYLGRVLTNVEERYTSIKKLYLFLYFTYIKLHYHIYYC
jgi:hypothetical protein